MGREKAEIGVLGLGLLGSALAGRLIGQGWQVCGYDIDPVRCGELTELGGEAAAGPQELISRADVVLLSLPTSAIAAQVIDQLLEQFRSGQTVIDTTTGEPQEMIALGQVLQRQGVHYIEATVAGSSEQVRRGEVALFLGGESTIVDTQTALLEAISPRPFYLGELGCGSRFKLVHNLILGLHRAVLAEGLQFAAAMGFEPARALEVLRQTPAYSTVMETKGLKMVSGDYMPQARLAQHLKDVRLILQQAKQHGIRTPLSELHRALLEQAEQLGYGKADNSAIIEVFKIPHDASE